jgi:hypothetical protein
LVSFEKFFFDPPFLARLSLHFIPLIGVLFLNWNLGLVMFFYFVEMLFEGFFHSMKILALPEVPGISKTREFLIFAFLELVILGFAAFAVFGLYDLPQASVSSLVLYSLVIFVAHLASFYLDFLKEISSRIKSMKDVKNPLANSFAFALAFFFVFPGLGQFLEVSFYPILMLASIIVVKLYFELNDRLKEFGKPSVFELAVMILLALIVIAMVPLMLFLEAVGVLKPIEEEGKERKTKSGKQKNS